MNCNLTAPSTFLQRQRTTLSDAKIENSPRNINSYPTLKTPPLPGRPRLNHTSEMILLPSIGPSLTQKMLSKDSPKKPRRVMGAFSKQACLRDHDGSERETYTIVNKPGETSVPEHLMSVVKADEWACECCNAPGGKQEQHYEVFPSNHTKTVRGIYMPECSNSLRLYGTGLTSPTKRVSFTLAIEVITPALEQLSITEKQAVKSLKSILKCPKPVGHLDSASLSTTLRSYHGPRVSRHS